MGSFEFIESYKIPSISTDITLQMSEDIPTHSHISLLSEMIIINIRTVPLLMPFLHTVFAKVSKHRFQSHELIIPARQKIIRRCRRTQTIDALTVQDILNHFTAVQKLLFGFGLNEDMCLFVHIMPGSFVLRGHTALDADSATWELF